MANKKTETAESLSEDIIEKSEKAPLDLKTTSGIYRIDDGVLVKVKSTYFGKLFYRNKKTGEATEWDRAGEIQIMSIGDLRAMKAEQISFYKNHWIVILGVADGSDCKATCADIYKALVITKFYDNYIEPTDYKAICALSEDEIAERVGMLSPGAQENLLVALNEYIKTGVLDSVRKIRAFETALGRQLFVLE